MFIVMQDASTLIFKPWTCAFHLTVAILGLGGLVWGGKKPSCESSLSKSDIVWICLVVKILKILPLVDLIRISEFGANFQTYRSFWLSTILEEIWNKHECNLVLP